MGALTAAFVAGACPGEPAVGAVADGRDRKHHQLKATSAKTTKAIAGAAPLAVPLVGLCCVTAGSPDLLI